MSETGSGTDRARSGVQEAAGQAQERLQQTAREAAGQAQGRVREQVDTRSTQAGQQVRSVADALRRTGEDLRGQQKEGPAKVLEQGAERAQRLGTYLEQSDADRILRDLEEFGRRQPLVVAAGAFVLGVAASRFLKASSSRRFQGTRMDRGLTARPYTETLPREAAPLETGMIDAPIPAPTAPPPAGTAEPMPTRPPETPGY